ncbi:putative manganese transporter [Adlercreutzia sp. ZJ154]|uniref:putative manganese transporter n=1 Tax=Adlercreutzia sp. ZJ154 TaxID=2709790 RepID=UPI0013EADF27|nr:putative manganese transporter [Adlercreutzia sp. ZJ154]
MDSFLYIAEHVLGHSFEDTLYLVPFLFVTYLLMEWLEHKTGAKTQNAIRHAGAAGPVIGAFLGVVPQCGFSAVSATLYAGRVITLGTLFAVFLSTSDEMLPIFIAEQVPPNTILSIMGAKVIIGMVMGFIVDAVLRLARRDKQDLRIHELCEHDNCGCSGDCATCTANPQLAYQHADDCCSDCTHEHHQHDHSHDAGWKGILVSALKHTVQVMVFIFFITIVLNAVLEVVGEDILGNFMEANPEFAVFASALVGLIPNCAASVVIADLYIEGVLGAGAMLAGLLVSAGVGILVLARANRHWKQNLAIIAALYVTGVFWGLIANALNIVF